MYFHTNVAGGVSNDVKMISPSSVVVVVVPSSETPRANKILFHCSGSLRLSSFVGALRRIHLFLLLCFDVRSILLSSAVIGSSC